MNQIIRVIHTNVLRLKHIPLPEAYQEFLGLHQLVNPLSIWLLHKKNAETSINQPYELPNWTPLTHIHTYTHMTHIYTYTVFNTYRVFDKMHQLNTKKKDYSLQPNYSKPLTTRLILVRVCVHWPVDTHTYYIYIHSLKSLPSVWQNA